MDDLPKTKNENDSFDIKVGPQGVQEQTPTSETSSSDNAPLPATEMQEQQNPVAQNSQAQSKSAHSSESQDLPNISPHPNSKVSDTPPPAHEAMRPKIVGQSPSGGNGFKIFMILGIVMVLAVWGGVGYLYFQNRSLKKEDTTETPIEQEIPQATPTPEFTPEQIKVKSGNIIRERPNGETAVLVNKSDHESTGITGFLKVAVSPDNNKMCFESWSPAPEPAIYISDIDGQNITEVSPNRQNCLWSNDSKKVYYMNTSSKTAPVNIFEYDLQTQFETDLTSESVPSGVVRRFEIVGLSADASKLICKYENLGGAAATETVSECEIDLQTKVVSEI